MQPIQHRLAILNEGVGTAILFTLLGIVDKRVADVLISPVIGLIVIGIIIPVASQTGDAAQGRTPPHNTESLDPTAVASPARADRIRVTPNREERTP